MFELAEAPARTVISGSEGFFPDNTPDDFQGEARPLTPEQIARRDRHQAAWKQRQVVREMDGVS